MHSLVANTAPAQYCEAIFELAEDDIEVVRARVAERLGVSRPAVSEMVQRLQELGLVETDDKQLRLTGDGQALAAQSVRRHRLAERLLVDVLGLGWAEAHDLAGGWQTVIDDTTEAAIDRVPGSPTTCPHGNPIPGAALDPDLAHSTVALAALPVDAVGQVVRVAERLEVEPGMLRSLESHGLVPGTRVQVLSVADDGAMAVQASRGVMALSGGTAQSILVVPGDLAAISDRVARDHA
jgi:DtxR family Mn-dependent transcriptional regulator